MAEIKKYAAAIATIVHPASNTLLAVLASRILPPERRITKAIMPVLGTAVFIGQRSAFLLPKRFGMILFVLREEVRASNYITSPPPQ